MCTHTFSCRQACVAGALIGKNDVTGAILDSPSSSEVTQVKLWFFYKLCILCTPFKWAAKNDYDNKKFKFWKWSCSLLFLNLSFLCVQIFCTFGKVLALLLVSFFGLMQLFTDSSTFVSNLAFNDTAAKEKLHEAAWVEVCSAVGSGFVKILLTAWR